MVLLSKPPLLGNPRELCCLYSKETHTPCLSVLPTDDLERRRLPSISALIIQDKANHRFDKMYQSPYSMMENWEGNDKVCRKHMLKKGIEGSSSLQPLQYQVPLKYIPADCRDAFFQRELAMALHEKKRLGADTKTLPITLNEVLHRGCLHVEHSSSCPICLLKVSYKFHAHSREEGYKSSRTKEERVQHTVEWVKYTHNVRIPASFEDTFYSLLSVNESVSDDAIGLLAEAAAGLYIQGKNVVDVPLQQSLRFIAGKMGLTSRQYKELRFQLIPLGLRLAEYRAVVAFSNAVDVGKIYTCEDDGCGWCTPHVGNSHPICWKNKIAFKCGHQQTPNM